MSAPSAEPDDGSRPDGLHVDLLEAVSRRVRLLLELAATETRVAAMSALAMLLLLMLCAASVIIAWALILASVLYAIAQFSEPSWPLVAVGFGAAHAFLAIGCWQLTARLGKNLTLPELRSALDSSAADPQMHKEKSGYEYPDYPTVA